MLKLRYLWVDALCIIQDDAVDKVSQLKYMGSNYKNATLTIAAASADTVHDGFLSDWPTDDESAILPILIPFENAMRSIGVIKSAFYNNSW